MSAPDAIRAVLFDKDGTLFDFYQVWVPAYRAAAQAVAERIGEPSLAARMLEASGFDTDSERFQPTSPLVSGTAIEICDAWRPVLAGRAPDDLLAVVEGVLDTWSSREVAPAADLEALFGGLAARGLKLGIATMDSEAALRATLRRWPWRRHLDFFCGYDSGHGSKPGPGMARAFAAAVGVAPAEIAVVGDSLADMAMARAAGAGLAIALASGPTPAEHLARDADVVLPDIEFVSPYLVQI